MQTGPMGIAVLVEAPGERDAKRLTTARLVLMTSGVCTIFSKDSEIRIDFEWNELSGRQDCNDCFRSTAPVKHKLDQHEQARQGQRMHADLPREASRV